MPRFALVASGAGMVAGAIVIGALLRDPLAEGRASALAEVLALLAVVLLVLGVELVLLGVGGPWRAYAEPVLDAVGELGSRRTRVRLEPTAMGVRMTAADRVVAIASARIVDVVRSGQHVVIATVDRAYSLGGMRIGAHPAVRSLEAAASRGAAARAER